VGYELLRLAVLVAVGLGAAVSEAVADPGWNVFQDEVPTLLYGDPENALISIICGRDEETGKEETWISVAVDNGTKPAKGKIVLILESKKTRKEVPLRPKICGDGECNTRAAGEVYLYEATFPGTAPALDIAEKATKISIDAHGAKVSAPAEEKAFSKFAGLCRNW
jgi:hypothetical protein